MFLTTEPLIINNKIDKPVIVDIDDKITAQQKPYTKENIIEYEINSRDSRIGELTNVSTCILNKQLNQEKAIKQGADDVSLLRILQGKEIDFLKTGVRWNMSRRLRNNLKKLPFFLLNNYEAKLQRYYKIRTHNENNPERKIPPNCFFSPSPMNELNDYITTWEKRNIAWDNRWVDNRDIILDHSIDYSDMELMKKVRKIVRKFSKAWSETMKKRLEQNSLSWLSTRNLNTDGRSDVAITAEPFIAQLNEIPGYDKKIIENYVINYCYKTISISKLFAWFYAGDTIITNLRVNTPPHPDGDSFKIMEIDKNVYKKEKNDGTTGICEYLGRYYKLYHLTKKEFEVMENLRDTE